MERARNGREVLIALGLVVACGGTPQGSGNAGGAVDAGQGSADAGGGGGGGGTGAGSAPIDRALDRVHAIVAQGPNFDLPALQAAVLADPQLQLVAPPSHDSLWVSIGPSGPRLVVAIDPTPTTAPHPRAPPPATALTELPGGKQYFLFTGLGSGWGDAAPDLAAMLQHASYTGTTGTATIDALRAVQNAAVFELKTHGALLTTPTDTYYALYTATPYPLQPEPASVSDDLLHGRLVVFDAVNRRGWTASDPEERHYAITAAFVQQYMTFAPNAFVMINACNSAGQAEPSSTMLAKGVGTFAGWDNFAAEDGSDTASRYLFDRLLGANRFRAESPAQRSFDSRAVKADMAAQGIDKTLTSGGAVATLRFAAPPGGPDALLAPGIQKIDFDEQAHTMTLTGSFGSRPGTVSVGGDAVPVAAWAPDRIVTGLPPGGGRVVVDVDHRISNDNGSSAIGVPLTEWRNLVLRFWLLAMDSHLIARITWKLHLRAHVQTFRDKPHDAPHDRSIDFLVADDSSADYAASGTFETNGGSISWAGGGSLPLNRSTSAGAEAYFNAFGTIDTKAHALQLHANAAAPGGWIWIMEGPGGTQRVAVDMVALPVPNTPPWTFDLQLDDHFNVVAGRTPAFGQNRNGVDVSAYWDWLATPANSPPDDQGAR